MHKNFFKIPLAEHHRPSAPYNFNFEQKLTFDNYIKTTYEHILASRTDLIDSNAERIADMNCPFDLLPENGNGRIGILLVHGLYDSPFTMQDVARHLQAAGFWVRSVLLPGHGTRPADLINVTREDWSSTVDYGVNQFIEEVDQLFVFGFSMGAVLTLKKAMHMPNLAGILLFAPAIFPTNKALPYTPYFRFLSKAASRFQWYHLSPEEDSAKYKCFPINAAYQTYTLCKEVRAQLNNHHFNCPIFIAMSRDDEVMDPQVVIDFFKQQKNPKSELIIYDNEVDDHDNRIILRAGAYPDKKIIDFSHPCILFSPDNFHYGAQGDYLHHLLEQANNLDDFVLGALSENNAHIPNLHRLTYNPDFDFMVERIKLFLQRALS